MMRSILKKCCSITEEKYLEKENDTYLLSETMLGLMIN